MAGDANGGKSRGQNSPRAEKNVWRPPGRVCGVANQEENGRTKHAGEAGAGLRGALQAAARSLGFGPRVAAATEGLDQGGGAAFPLTPGPPCGGEGDNREPVGRPPPRPPRQPTDSCWRPGRGWSWAAGPSSCTGLRVRGPHKVLQDTVFALTQHVLMACGHRPVGASPRPGVLRSRAPSVVRTDPSGDHRGVSGCSGASFSCCKIPLVHTSPQPTWRALQCCDPVFMEPLDDGGSQYEQRLQWRLCPDEPVLPQWLENPNRGYNRPPSALSHCSCLSRATWGRSSPCKWHKLPLT